MTYHEYKYSNVVSILQDYAKEEYSCSCLIDKMYEIMYSKFHNIKIENYKCLGLLFDELNHDNLLQVMKIFLSHINNPNIHIQNGDHEGKTLLKTVIDIKHKELLELLISNNHGSMIDGYNEPLIIDSESREYIESLKEGEEEEEEEEEKEEEPLEKKKEVVNVIAFGDNLYKIATNDLLVNNDGGIIVCIGKLVDDQIVKILTNEEKEYCKSQGMIVNLN
jgi:hypothetical protein